MSCKDSFSLFGIDDLISELPSIPINDELMSIVSQQPLVTPETNFDILLNKHLNNHEITDVQLQQLPENQRNALVQIQSKGKDKKKRPDECQKLFYKRAFKYSQHKFFKRCKNRSRKMSHFYHYHFDTVCKSQNIAITHFYHPNKKTKPGLVIGQKTFNAKYVKLLLKSKTFLEDIKQYHRMFIDECLRERKTKMISFTNSIQRILQRAHEDERILLKYLQSSQCKIPWTLEEINQTWEYAQRDLYDYLQPDEQAQKECKRQKQVSLGQNIQLDIMIDQLQ